MSAQTTAVDLFTGTEARFGGLSNERELVAQCPQAFFDGNNPWARLASSIFFGGADMKAWAWKSRDEEIRKRQRSCLRAALGGFELPHEQKEALCAWMLSEMLAKVPS